MLSTRGSAAQAGTRLRMPPGRPGGPCAPRAVLSSAVPCGLQVRDLRGQRGRLDEPGEAARRRHDHQGAAARRPRARAAQRLRRLLGSLAAAGRRPAPLLPPRARALTLLTRTLCLRTHPPTHPPHLLTYSLLTAHAQADVVVLNMGHHYHNLDPAFSRYGGMVKMALRGLARHMKPTAQLVFRTTNVGHHGCQKRLAPAAQPARGVGAADGGQGHLRVAAAAGLQGCAQGGRRHVQGQVQLARPAHVRERVGGGAACARRPSPRASACSTSPSSTRAPTATWRARCGTAPPRAATAPSGRREFPLDCLHYCYPGPADFWALALYNLMLNNPRFRAL